ncbi:polysaccharide deacetylase family protein [Furfurilactobacillus sp. WILCCON 0119]|uniref:polysaccharide deacetylase family protein n=1 Tax=Furfurilactobacillus entadae TaxID=2922307 RepID=UPI0035EC0FA3
MSKTTRKWLLAGFAVIICVILGITVQRSIQFELGNRPSYAVSARDQHKQNGIMVFCYHRVLNDTDTVKLDERLSPNSQFHDFNVNLSTFKKQMAALKRDHVTVISTTQMTQMLNEHRHIHGRYVVLTFDDIDRTTIDNAAPVMKQHHFPFTVSIITGDTGAYRDGTKLASWPQILTMKKDMGNLVTFAVHTNNMHYLTRNGTPVFNVPGNFSKFRRDYAVSQDVMQEKIGAETPIFTYPYGSGTPQVQSFLERQPLQVIYTLNTGIVTRHTDLRSTPRIIINDNSWPSVNRWLTQSAH